MKLKPKNREKLENVYINDFLDTFHEYEPISFIEYGFTPLRELSDNFLLEWYKRDILCI